MVVVLVALALAGVAAYLDASTGRIPNRLTGPSFAFGLVFALLHGLRPALWSFSGVIAAIAIWLAIEATGRVLGGGDVKLLTSLGALLGPLAVAVASIVAAAAYLTLPRRIEQPVAPLLAWGIAIYCAGALLC